ncbi:uncharacterized protein IL334_005171 [Kwoniella shivajii]|uniref:Protein CPL1-like domain-containing protein n=1 Tax=Kwoniella shivajii TaxID=564305 RepID=A0ABZ1D5E4_9TREE|nr:hypothetical protein IL334_005171 [Kwoniella shivajii]
MFSAIVAFAPVALLLCLRGVSAVTYDNEFASCVSNQYQPNNGFNSGSWSSASSCAAYCYDRNTENIYAAWDPQSGLCGCGTNSFTDSQTTLGNPGGCAAGSSYEVYIIHTTYDFLDCSNNYQFGGALYQSQSTDYYSIFQTCASYPYMAIYPAGNGIFAYACGSTLTQTSTQTCNINVNRLYSHPADATASSIARRSMNERRRLAEQESLKSWFCPKGLTPCALETDSASFECIDIKNELESCGGCIFGAFNPPGYANTTVPMGTDCSSIKGVALGHSSCVDGSCHFDCMKGWEVEGDQCVRI